jgi:hypothetical protein
MSASNFDTALSWNSRIRKRNAPLLGTLAIAMLAALVLAILLVVPIPIHGRIVSSLMDLMHAPAFALLAWLVCRAASRRLPVALWQKLLVVALPLALCGLVAEMAQAFVHRGASWHDARANLFGACAGVCLYELWSRKITVKRWSLVLASLVFFAGASAGPLLVLSDCWRQQRQFPLLASFDNALEITRFDAQESTIERIHPLAGDPNGGLEIELHPGLYPGVLLADMPQDWSGYQTLAFDVLIDDGPPLNTIVKVHDREHRLRGFKDDDRFDGQFRLTPGFHQIRIPLADIRSAPRTRQMNMQDIDTWQLFTYHLTQPRTIVLDNLRLE